VGQEFADPNSAPSGLFQGAPEAIRSQAIQSFQFFLQGNEDDSPLGLLRERWQIPFLVTPESVRRPFPSGKDRFIGDNVPIGSLLSSPIFPDLKDGETGGKLGVEASRQILRIERMAEDDLHGLVSALDAEGKRIPQGETGRGVVSLTVCKGKTSPPHGTNERGDHLEMAEEAGLLRLSEDEPITVGAIRLLSAIRMGQGEGFGVLLQPEADTPWSAHAALGTAGQAAVARDLAGKGSLVFLPEVIPSHTAIQM